MMTVRKGTNIITPSLRRALPEKKEAFPQSPSTACVEKSSFFTCLFRFSFEAEGSSDVDHVPLPREEPGVGVAAHVQLQLPEPVHRRGGVHRLHQRPRQVSRAALHPSVALYSHLRKI